MKHRYVLTAMFLLLHFMAKSQNSVQDTFHLPIDSVTFVKVINREFSNVINGEPKAMIGSFAGLDVTNGIAAFNASHVFKKGFTALSLNVSGGINEGTVAIFNNSRVSSNASIELKFNILSKQKSKIRSYLEEIEARNINLRHIDNIYNQKINSIDNQVVYLNSLISFQEKEIERVKSDTRLGKEESNFMIAAKQKQIDSAKFILSNEYFDIERMKVLLNRERKKVRNEASLDFEISGIGMQWFGFYYRANNKNFYLFNPSLPSENQTKKQSFTGHNVGIEFNKFLWSNQPFESYYIRIGAGFLYDDNRDNLTRIEITDVKEYGSPGNSRTSTKKFSAYMGEYEKNTKSLAIDADYYQFLFQNNTSSIHFYPSLILGDGSEPIYNLGFGFMYSFKDKKDNKGKAIINAELYYDIIDVGNIRESSKSLFERNEVGLRFGLPLKIFNNN